MAIDPQWCYWASASIDGEVKIWHYNLPQETFVIRHEPDVLRIFAMPDKSLMLGGDFPTE